MDNNSSMDSEKCKCVTKEKRIQFTKKGWKGKMNWQHDKLLIIAPQNYLFSALNGAITKKCLLTPSIREKKQTLSPHTLSNWPIAKGIFKMQIHVEMRKPWSKQRCGRQPTAAKVQWWIETNGCVSSHFSVCLPYVTIRVLCVSMKWHFLFARVDWSPSKWFYLFIDQMVINFFFCSN